MNLDYAMMVDEYWALRMCPACGKALSSHIHNSHEGNACIYRAVSVDVNEHALYERAIVQQACQDILAGVVAPTTFSEEAHEES